MNGMDMGVATRLGSFAFFIAVWVSMMAAMMLPGAAPGGAADALMPAVECAPVPLFVGSYLAVWTLVGVAVYAVYRPHGSVAAGAVVIAAGVYEFTPLKQHFRRRCRESVALWIRVRAVLRRLEHRTDADAGGAGRHERHLDVVIAVLVLAQKLLPANAAIDVPLALAIVGLGILDRHRALVGSRTHATDVRRHRCRGQASCCRKTTRRRETMTDHKTGTREEWLAARLELLEAEKALTRRSDELARQRQELPWVRIDKEYRFDTDEGTASLADLFGGRSQLLIYHFMFGPDYTAGCPACSAIADGFNGFVVHLANHDVMLWAVSRAPLAKLQALQAADGLELPLGVLVRQRLQLRLPGRASPRSSERVGGGRVQLPRVDRAVAARRTVRGPFDAWAATIGHGLGDLHAREAPGHERVRARGRRRLPHLLGLRARAGRPLGHVPVARPGAARAKRGARPGRPTQLFPPPRRVRQRLTPGDDKDTDPAATQTPAHYQSVHAHQREMSLAAQTRDVPAPLESCCSWPAAHVRR